jgi:histone H3/H4
MASYFRHCSICKQPIQFGSAYYQCSVSTCNQKRTALYFCSVACWDAHVPGARHRDAWAEHVTAPLTDPDTREDKATSTEKASPERRVVGPRKPAETERDSDNSDDILVVVSRLKKYVAETAEMNTSSQGMSVLSAHLRRLCDDAIVIAQRDGRKTLLERDFEQAVRNWSSRS